MADDDLNQPTTEQAFNNAVEERRQLEQELKLLLKDLEQSDPQSVDALADRLTTLQAKRAKLQPS